MKIFLIAGIGADTRVYNNIDLGEHDVTCVDYIQPHKTDTLSTYAQKLIHQYHITPKSAIIGDSLGGMMAVEIAKIIPMDKVILISSIKTKDEEPYYFSLFRLMPVYRLIPDKVFISVGFMFKRLFKDMSDADVWLFKDMLKKSSPKFLRWAMEACLRWQNEIVPKNLYHIIGDKDNVFNYKQIKEPIIVKNGTHLMVYDKGKQITSLIKKILKK